MPRRVDALEVAPCDDLGLDAERAAGGEPLALDARRRRSAVKRALPVLAVDVPGDGTDQAREPRRRLQRRARRCVEVATRRAKEVQLVGREGRERLLVGVELGPHELRRSAGEERMVVGMIADSVAELDELVEHPEVRVSGLEDLLAAPRLLRKVRVPRADDEERRRHAFGGEVARQLHRVRVRSVVPGERQHAVGKVAPVDRRAGRRRRERHDRAGNRRSRARLLTVALRRTSRGDRAVVFHRHHPAEPLTPCHQVAP